MIAASDTRLIVRGVLALLFVVMVVSLGIFMFSLFKQREYSSSALPSLTPEGEVETSEEDGSSVFNLDLGEGPFTEGSFATRLDDDFAFEQLPEPPRPTYDPEPVGLPSLEVLTPVQSETAEDPVVELESHFEPMASDFNSSGVMEDEEPLELPSFASQATVDEEDRPEESEEERMSRWMEEEEEDFDFTPVVEKPSSSIGIRRLKLPAEVASNGESVGEIDRMYENPVPSSFPAETPSTYVGRRRAE